MPELLAAPDYGDLATFDMVDGWRVPRKMSNVANWIASNLAIELNACLPDEDCGFVARSTILRLKPHGRPWRADVAFIASDRFDLRTAPEDDPWDAVPNLAVEVISPSNTVAEIEEKLEQYFAAGVELALVVSARVRRVTAYRSMKNVVVHDGSDVIDLAPALPGAALRLDDIYQRFGK